MNGAYLPAPSNDTATGELVRMDGVANLTDEEKAMLAGEMGEPKRWTSDQFARVGAEDGIVNLTTYRRNEAVVAAFAIDGGEHLVEMPPAIGARARPSQPSCIGLSELHRLASDCFV